MKTCCPSIPNGGAGPAFLPDRLGSFCSEATSGMIPGIFACVFVSALGDRTATLQGCGHTGGGRYGFRRRVVFVSAANSDAVAGVERPVIETALTDLWYGFGVALQPHNLMWCFIGVLVGNMVGVLPGMGPLATISILLPLTFGIKPVGAILMLAGVMYGAQYGGAICSILLNLPCHPPHAVTCLDGFPMTKQGRGGVALGLTVMALLRRCLLGHHGNDLSFAGAGAHCAGVRSRGDLFAHAARPAGRARRSRAGRRSKASR